MNISFFRLFFLLLLSLLVSASYSNTLQCPFFFDDYGNILDNRHIRIEKISKESLIQVWTAPHLSKNRKISNLSFALNYVHGQYEVRGYHIVNIVIHICCGLLAALFFSQTIHSSYLKNRYHYLSSWIAALIWVLHPIQINAVTYIVQRMTSLALMFSLISMITWMAGRNCQTEKSYGKAIIWWMLSGIAWIAGMLSKEHIAVLPLLIIAHEFLLLRQEPIRVKRSWILIGGIGMMTIIFFFLNSEMWKQILSGYHRRDFTMTERLMTQSRVLWHYISLFYFPIAERFGIIYEYPVSRGVLTPLTTMFSIFAWILVLLSAWIFRRRYAVWTWMVCWFFISHLIESTVIPLENIFEHRMYLPSIGLCFASVLIFQDICSKYLNKILFKQLIFFCILIILGTATYTRNADFKDEVTLYRAELKRVPKSERIRLNLSLALNRAGYFSEGSAMLEQMVREYPDDIVILQNWYNFLMRVKQDPYRAEPVYRHITDLIKLGKYSLDKDAIALQNLADFCFENAEYEKTLFFVEKLLKMYYKHDSLWLLKGICHAKSEQWELAVQSLHRAWKISPDDGQILYWYGQSLLRTGNRDTGCDYLLRSAHSKTNKEAADLSRKAFSDNCE